jgi:hypothetical protein
LIESHSVRSLEQEIIAEMIKGRSFVGSRGDNSYSSNQSTSKSNNQSMTQREDNSYIHYSVNLCLKEYLYQFSYFLKNLPVTYSDLLICL